MINVNKKYLKVNKTNTKVMVCSKDGHEDLMDINHDSRKVDEHKECSNLESKKEK